jgi:hypothetical protein
MHLPSQHQTSARPLWTGRLRPLKRYVSQSFYPALSTTITADVCHTTAQGEALTDPITTQMLGC